MRILLYKKNHLIASSGGAEKIMITYANEFAKRGNEVILATRDPVEGQLFFELNKEVVFKHFNFKFSPIRRFIGKLLAKLGVIDNFPYFNRELLVSTMLGDYANKEEVDAVIVAGIQDLIDFTAYGNRNFPVIMMMHSHPNTFFIPSREKYYNQYINNASTIQVLLDSYQKAIPTCYKGPIVTIGNPIEAINISNNRQNVIIYMARITKGKQHHLLIEAFAKIANKHPQWQVHFYGDEIDAKYATQCKTEVKNKGLEKQIIFKGITRQVAEVLTSAKICAFPSYFEGFSLALTEAMAAGLPAIGFEYCSGVNEIIENNKTGFLVKDVDEFADKLDLLISNEELREQMGVEAQKICKAYTMDNIMNQWLTLIKKVTEK